MRRYDHRSEQIRELVELRKKEEQSKSIDQRYKMHLRQTEGRVFDDLWEVDLEYIMVLEIIGSGAYGNVHKGILKDRIPLLEKHPNARIMLEGLSQNNITVAVKKTPNHSDEFAANELISEIEFMKNLGFHAHILSLLGCISSRKNPMLILEYCENGDLLTFIKNEKQQENQSSIEPKRLLSFAWQIADGMLYLTTKNIVHRDLAARNVLLTKSLTAKISDFGLCRSVNTELYVSSNGGRLPLKWMSPEAIEKFEFSSKSDVWAFGVTLWELFTHGNLPYPLVAMENLLDLLKGGIRLPKPELANEEM